jgi:hypothetical protein
MNMTFTIANWGCQQPSMNAGQESVTPFGAPSPVVENTVNVFTYSSPNDTVATITASNYFLSQYKSLSVNDIIWGNGTDASFAVQVTSVSSTSVTVASMGLTTSIGTANIVNNAVTYAKFQQVAAASLVGNPTGGLANAEGITLGNGLAFAGTTLELNPNLLNMVEVSLSAAQFNGMYATPVQLVAAPGANNVILVDKVVLNMTFVSAQYAAGGAVGLQYGNTAHLAGPAASATEAASDYTSAAASTLFSIAGSLSTGAPVASAANAGVFISNASGAFTTGDGTFNVRVWYKVVPTNS